jgi:hypothetical protein
LNCSGRPSWLTPDPIAQNKIKNVLNTSKNISGFNLKGNWTQILSFVHTHTTVTEFALEFVGHCSIIHEFIGI